jgi:group II intron reverse transcriptase/maturase
LAVAALEDKIVQRATVAVLSCIYEEEFLGLSYGFRPKRGQHDALDALVVGITDKKVNFILDADVRSFFDEVSQHWLIRFVEHRVGDPRIIRLIQKWLKVGVLEDGVVAVSEKGTGQGSVISPLLANVYLHYVFDLWAERWRRREATGGMMIVRYADDSVPRTHRRKKVRNCVRDGGRSSGAGRQGQASNHRKLRRSKAGVVSVAEKAGLDPVRYGSERRARANR